jgi:hypothetical protein
MSKKRQDYSYDDGHENEWFAVTRWHADDVKRFRPEWSDDFCATVLSSVESGFEELLIERGNEILDSMIESFEETWLESWGYLNEK